MPRARLALLIPSLSLAMVGTGGVLGPAAAANPSITLIAKGSPGTRVSGASQFAITGDSAASVGVATVSGGSAKLVAGPGGDLPSAVQFPSYVASGTYPRAVLRLTPSSGAAFTPGNSDFTYGAVVRLDARSSGRSNDNGDNVLQRGLYNEPSMFKLELDAARPACTVRGSAGLVVLRSTTITRGVWYRVTCSRTSGVVSIAVARVGASSASTARIATTRPTGNLSFTSSRPASVGGKLTARGAVATSASDQFNGAIAQVWVSRQ